MGKTKKTTKTSAKSKNSKNKKATSKKQTLSAESLLELKFISNPILHPTGTKAVAVHTHIHNPNTDEQEKTTEQKTKKQTEQKPPSYHSHIYMYDLADLKKPLPPVQLTQQGTSNVKPAFSPDGTMLAFMSNRPNPTQKEGEKPQAQLYVLPLAGGEARALTNCPKGIESFAWHPDSEQIAYVARVPQDDIAEPKADAPKTISKKIYKWNGVGLLPKVPASLYLYSLKEDTHTKLHTPEFSLSSLAFSADGKSLFFSAPKDEHAESEWHSSIWRLPLTQKTTTQKKVKEVVTGEYMSGDLVTHPDNSSIGFVGKTTPENYFSGYGFWSADTKKKNSLKRITGLEDEEGSANGDSHYGSYPNTAVWLADSEGNTGVVVNLNKQGYSGLYYFAEPNEEGDILSYAWHDDNKEQSISSFACVATEAGTARVIYLSETPTKPAELYCQDIDLEKHVATKPSQLSHLNKDFCDKYDLASVSKVHHVKVEGKEDGSEVEIPYWVVSPSQPRADEAVVLEVHGGPQTNYGYGFIFEFHYLAAQGYTVVYGNPRGSSSYGLDFAQNIAGDYGGDDADDVLAIINAAMKKHSNKKAPVHLTGGSYGGFMTNWLVGHTDMFTSAVTQRSISNWLSFYGTSDIGYKFAHAQLAGNVWDNTEDLWRQSPLAYVHQVNTPLLIIHAEQDLRCPLEQAEQLFVCLKDLGKETELVQYPDETHELSRSGRPDRRIHRLEAIANWFNNHAPKS